MRIHCCALPIVLAACAVDPSDVVVTVPTPGSTGVSVLVQPVVVVDTDEIELRAMGREAPVPIRIEPDGRGGRLVVPLEALDYALPYTLWVDEEPYTFRTSMNPRLATIVHQPNSDWVTRFVLDRSGFEVGEEELDDAGPDGEWLTPDDPLSRYQAIDYEGPLVVQRTWVSGAGDDMVWYTDDDRASQRTRFTYNDAQFPLAVEGYDAGPDGRYDTDDDVQNLLLTYEHDEAGRPIREATLDTGPDARYGTADDIPWSYVDTLRDDAGRTLAQMAAYGPG
ncbi:MAG: hypothetical protein AAF602_16590, partial [Myxococcota bacterium]